MAAVLNIERDNTGRQCGSLVVSQVQWPPRPVEGTTVPVSVFAMTVCYVSFIHRIAVCAVFCLSVVGYCVL
jgi:hypothetical protein